MNLSDVLNSLGSCELSLTLESDNQGGISKDRINYVINIINLGLVDIYQNFKLKTVYKNIPIEGGKTVYEVNDDKDVLEIIDIIDSNGISIPINNTPNFMNQYQIEYSSGFYVELTTPTTLKLGKGIIGTYFTIQYKALHNRLSTVTAQELDTFDPTTVDMELPYVYLNALTYFVAHKLATSKNLQGILGRSPFHVGNNYKARYDAELMSLRNNGYDIGNMLTDNNFIGSGFV